MIALQLPSRVTLRRTPLALCAIALAALSLAAAPVRQAPPEAVRVDTVRMETLTNRRPVTGDLRAAHRGRVATREKGLVAALLVDEGQVVQRGTVLAQLDATQLELDLTVLRAQRPPSEANVLERRANLERAQSDLDSLTALVERKAANPKELVDARADLAAAEARLSASEALLTVIDAQLAKLEQRIVDMTIRAPFDGTVVQTLTELGSWVAEGSPVVELLSTDQLEVWLEVPQDLFAATQQHREALEVRLGSSSDRFALDEYSIVPDVDRRARAFRVVGKVQSELPMAAGMSVTAFVPTGKREPMLTVPRDAILHSQVSAFVYGVIPGGEGEPSKAAPLDVEVLFQTTERAVIRSSAVREGMQVVVEGNERLYPMAAIIPMPVGGETNGVGGGPNEQGEGSSR